MLMRSLSTEGDYQTHAYLANGAPLPGWPIESDDPSYTIVDLDGDGDFEIVTFINWTSEGADLVAYHHNGVPVDNFMIQFEPYGHPLFVAGDVDGDGDNEIILFSRTFDAPYFALYVVGSTGLMGKDHPSRFVERTSGSTFSCACPGRYGWRPYPRNHYWLCVRHPSF